MDLTMQILTMQTNDLLVSFVVNNIVLLFVIKRILEYVVSKTKTKSDDDLPDLFGSIINLVRNKGRQRKPKTEEPE